MIKQPKEILYSIPLECIADLQNKQISEIFGISESTVSHIMSDKWGKESAKTNRKEFKTEAEIEHLSHNSWMKSQERIAVNNFKICENV